MYLVYLLSAVKIWTLSGKGAGTGASLIQGVHQTTQQALPTLLLLLTGELAPVYAWLSAGRLARLIVGPGPFGGWRRRMIGGRNGRRCFALLLGVGGARIGHGVALDVRSIWFGILVARRGAVCRIGSQWRQAFVESRE